MADYAYIGLTGTQAIDNAHAWLLNDADGVEGGAFSKSEYTKYCRAMAMGADGIFYIAGYSGSTKNVVVKTAFGGDLTIWETVLTCDNYDYSNGIIYEPVNDLIVAISKKGSFNVLSNSGVELWHFEDVDSLRGIVSDADGYVYVCGDRTGGQLGEATTASVWKLEWDTDLLQYDVIAYYDTGDNIYDIAIDSSGNLLVCGNTSGSKNVWKLTPALTLSADWLIADYTVLHSCGWLSTGNFVVAGVMPAAQNQVQLIDASTGATIWGKIPHVSGSYFNTIRTVRVDASDNVHAIRGQEYSGE